MKLYNALVKKNTSGEIEDIILLKEGFSFSAFLFGALWFFYRKMWLEFAIVTAIYFIFSLSSFWAEFDKFYLEVSFLIIVALNSNYWFGEHLRKKKYEFAGLVFGKDEEEARLRFLEGLESSAKI